MKCSMTSPFLYKQVCLYTACDVLSPRGVVQFALQVSRQNQHYVALWWNLFRNFYTILLFLFLFSVNFVT